MEKEVLEKYRKAGKICGEVKEELAKMIKPGMKILDIAKTGEEMIIKKGGMPAFPINISINEVAAHYTPSANDQRTIKEGEIVKVDLGVHIDGYIVDSAFTYCSEKSELIKCAEKAAEAPLKIIKPGIKVNEIGECIEDFVKSQGLGVIINLTGHGLERYVSHAPPTIPNTKNDINHEIKEGDVIAIEPFVTPAMGSVKNTNVVEIYSYIQDRPVRLPEARKILEMAKNDYGGLPFAKRWLCEKISQIKVSLALRELENVNAVETHPVLRESDNQPSAQAEHTIIVSEKPVVLDRQNAD